MQQSIKNLRSKNGFDSGAVRNLPQPFYHALNHSAGTNEYAFFQFQGSIPNKSITNLPKSGAIGLSDNDVYKLHNIGFELKPSSPFFPPTANDLDAYLRDMYLFWAANAYVELEIGSNKIGTYRLQDCVPPTQFLVMGNTTDTTTAAAARRIGSSTLQVLGQPIDFSGADIYINGGSQFSVKLVMPPITFITPSPQITAIIDGVLLKTA